jgi:hypothetical protein
MGEGMDGYRGRMRPDVRASKDDLIVFLDSVMSGIQTANLQDATKSGILDKLNASVTIAQRNDRPLMPDRKTYGFTAGDPGYADGLLPETIAILKKRLESDVLDFKLDAEENVRAAQTVLKTVLHNANARVEDAGSKAKPPAR